MSRYQALAEQTQQLIDDGILRAGDRLPSIRQACRTHDISPVTVMQAYYLLENRGLIEARPRSGYFVRARLGHKLSEPGMTQELAYEHAPGAWQPSIPVTPETRPAGGLGPI